MDEDDKELDLAGMNPAQRIQYLERSLMFLRQQHTDVLRALHEEVEGLKKENKGKWGMDSSCAIILLLWQWWWW